MVSIRSYLAKQSLRATIAGLRRCLLLPLFAAITVAGADDPSGLFNQWFVAQTNLQSWSADFTQTLPVATSGWASTLSERV